VYSNYTMAEQLIISQTDSRDSATPESTFTIYDDGSSERQWGG